MALYADFNAKWQDVVSCTHKGVQEELALQLELKLACCEPPPSEPALVDPSSPVFSIITFRIRVVLTRSLRSMPKHGHALAPLRVESRRRNRLDVKPRSG
jgi:hypothetical protein